MNNFISVGKLVEPKYGYLSADFLKDDIGIIVLGPSWKEEWDQVILVYWFKTKELMYHKPCEIKPYDKNI